MHVHNHNKINKQFHKEKDYTYLIVYTLEYGMQGCHWLNKFFFGWVGLKFMLQ